jgi:Ca-activated chloride channel homolog
VLISDGSGLDAAARAEAARLATGGVRLFTLALGAGSDGEASLEALGVASAPARAPRPVIDRLSGSLALARDGRAAGLAFEDLGPLVAALALVPALARDGRAAGLAFEDLGPLVAALALVPFLSLFRRRA